MSRRAAVLFLAPLVASCGTDEGSEEAPWFAEEARTRGLVFQHVSGARGEHWLPEIMGGGCALFDLDGDGWLDAYLVQSGSLDPENPADGRNRLFANAGGGRFEDKTEGSGADDAGYGMGVACGDVDGDGAVDLYVTNVGANALLANRGGGRFEDVTAAAGVGDAGWGTSAAFFDLDLDGALDLYVCNYLSWTPESELDCTNAMGMPDYCSPQSYKAPAIDVLYRNAGGGRFENVTDESGVGSAPGTGLGVACADFDADGWLDVFVANDGMPDFLWRNGGGGTFEEAALSLGCAVDQNGFSKAGMGVAVADVDGDGDPDLLVGNLNEQSDSFFLNENGWFRDRTLAAGLGSASRPFTRFGLGWRDFDGDGALDLYQVNGRVMRQARRWSEDPFAEPNLLLRGVDAGFEEVLPRGGTALPLVATSRGAAFGDVDGDGGVDVLVVNRDGPAHLLRNVAPDRGAWVAFRPVDERGRDVLNAVVSVTVDGRTLVRETRAASSYLASSDPRVHFGLGDAAEARDVRVRWPDGTTEAFGDRAAGGVHELKRGAGR